jgi:large subunit ribosomal protein L15
MPLQRRLPKFGFTSPTARFSAEVRLSALAKCEGDVVDLQSLQRANLVQRHVRRVKIIASGAIDRAVTIRGLGITKGARAAIERAGGTVEDVTG